MFILFIINLITYNYFYLFLLLFKKYYYTIHYLKVLLNYLFIIKI
jgi:hypothetical protein